MLINGCAVPMGTTSFVCALLRPLPFSIGFRCGLGAFDTESDGADAASSSCVTMLTRLRGRLTWRIGC
jgi:hypothetical protein